MSDEEEQPPPRRSKLAGFALLAVVVIGVLIVSIALRPDETEPPPAEAPSALPAPMVEVVRVDFADDRHGFALRSRCTEDECDWTLLVTDDRQHWTARNVAAGDLSPAEFAWGLEVVALGPCHVLVGDVESYGFDLSRDYSDDCGRTWTSVATLPQGTVAQIPQGGILEPPCNTELPDHDGCDEQRLVVTLPDTGGRAWLESSPELERQSPVRVPAPDGNWWVSGWDPATGELAVAVSRDDGRTWSVSTLGWGETDVGHVAVTTTERDAYVAAFGYRPSAGHGLLAIFHSGDGGATWAQSWRAGAADPPTDGTPIATMPDELLIIDWDHTWRSTDNGLTFDIAGPDIPVDWARWTRGGFLGRGEPAWSRWQRCCRSPDWYRSSDGMTWEKLPFPR